MPFPAQPVKLNANPLPVGFATKTAEQRAARFLSLTNWWPSYSHLNSIEVVPGFAPVGSMSSLGVFDLETIEGGEQSSSQKRRYFLTGDTSTWLLTTAGVTTKIKGALTAGQQFSIIDFDDTTFFFNGADTPFKFDYSADNSTAVSDMGLTQPTLGSFAAATNGTGNVKREVTYFVSFMSGTTELALSDAGPSVDAGNGSTIFLSNVPTGGGGITARRIYRTFGGGTQPFYAGSIDDNTTTTFEENNADVDLAGPPPKHGEPPPSGAKYAVVHFNRLWIAGHNENEVWWSDLNQPESFNKWSFLNVWEKDGDLITGLSRFKDGIIVWKFNHVYKAIGRDPEAEIMEVVEVKSSDPKFRAIGCPSHHAIAAAPLGHYFYYNKGFYIIDEGCSIEYLSFEIEDQLRDDINEEAQEKIVAEYWQNRRCVFFSVPTGSSTKNDTTYIYWIDTGTWSKINEGFISFATVEVGSDGSPPDGFQFWGCRQLSTAEAKVQRLDHPTAKTFNGDDVVASAELPPLYAEDPSVLVQWMWSHVEFEALTETDTNLTLNYRFGTSTGAGTDVSFHMQNTNFERQFKRVYHNEISRQLHLTLKCTVDTSTVGSPTVHSLHTWAHVLGAVDVR